MMKALLKRGARDLAWALILLLGPGAGLASRGASAAVEITQSDGFTWCTVGNPGNAPWVGRTIDYADISVGGVDHEFRIGRTEVTVAQYFPFLKAYEPFIPANERQLYQNGTGSIEYSGGTLLQRPNTDNWPVDISWRTAARFCNWLHNGRVNQAWAFETGAYDTSTFGRDPQTHAFTDTSTHLPGARYWIPSLDEWIKAAHFDPDRYGSGQAGYWLYPHSSDTAPITGLPGTGAQADVQTAIIVDVGSYPSVRSPYGLLDAVGNLSEWTEDWQPDGYRMIRGDDYIGRSQGIGLDRLNGWYVAYPPTDGGSGLRMATVVPTHGSIGLSGAVGLALGVKRRRRK